MNKPTVKIHNTKDAVWHNAAGDAVPVKYVSRADRQKEIWAGALYKQALKAEEVLQDLHTAMKDGCEQIAAMVRHEYEIKNGKKPRETKGNLTWYSFDGSIKVEANVNEVVKWDDALMTEAKALLNDYLDSQLTDNQALIKKLVSDAFSNHKGGIDSRKIFQLLKYDGQIKSSKFSKACELMRQAQMIDRTKLYMGISVRLQDGNYRAITLNFSSI
jgi:hypothetical protein